MNDKRDWHDKVNDALFYVSNCRDRVERLIADLSCILGESAPPLVKLRGLRELLEKAHGLLREGISEAVGEFVQRAGESSQNMLMAALAGAGMQLPCIKVEEGES